MRRFLFCLALSTSLLAAAGPEDEVKAAEKRWVTATTKMDYAELGKVLADELIYVHSTGDADSKKQFVDNLKSNYRVYQSIDYEKSEVKMVGADMALLTATVRMKVVTNGKPGDNRLAFLHVWLKRKGGWQLVGHQSARLP